MLRDYEPPLPPFLRCKRFYDIARDAVITTERAEELHEKFEEGFDWGKAQRDTFTIGFGADEKGLQDSDTLVMKMPDEDPRYHAFVWNNDNAYTYNKLYQKNANFIEHEDLILLDLEKLQKKSNSGWG